MAAIASSIEISRPVDQVFAYAIDPAHLPEWQENVVSAHVDGGGEPQEGSRIVTTRRVGPRQQTMTMQVTELTAPHGWALRGIDGPVRATVTTTIEPLDDGARSRVTIELDFAGHGIGKVLVPFLVRPQSKRGLPRNLQLLKERVESEG